MKKIILILVFITTSFCFGQRPTTHRGKVRLNNVTGAPAVSTTTNQFLSITNSTGEIQKNSYAEMQALFGGGGSPIVAGVGLTNDSGTFNLGGQMPDGSDVGINLGADIAGFPFVNNSTFSVNGNSASITVANSFLNMSGTNIDIYGDTAVSIGSDTSLTLSTDGGDIVMSNGVNSVIGQVWTATGVGGQGYWANSSSSGSLQDMNSVIDQGGSINGIKSTNIGASGAWSIDGSTGMQLAFNNDDDEIIFGNASSFDITAKAGGLLQIGNNSSVNVLGSLNAGTVAIRSPNLSIRPDPSAVTVGHVLTATDAAGTVSWQTPQAPVEPGAISFTPTVSDLGSGATYQIFSSNCTVIKSGKMASIKVIIEFTGTTGVPTGVFVIGGIPMAVSGNAILSVHNFTGSNLADSKDLIGIMDTVQEIIFTNRDTSDVKAGVVLAAGGKITITGNFVTL